MRYFCAFLSHKLTVNPIYDSVVLNGGRFNMKTNKLKYLVVGLLLVCMLGICGCSSKAAYEFNIKTSPDFRDCNLYDSYKTVKANENFVKTGETTLGAYTILTYKDVVLDGFKASIIYQINDDTDELYTATAYYYPTDDQMDDVYDSLVKKCNELYGTNYLFVDSNSHTWKANGKYVVVYQGTNNVYYSVNTPEAYE